MRLMCRERMAESPEYHLRLGRGNRQTGAGNRVEILIEHWAPKGEALMKQPTRSAWIQQAALK
jgi:hypothetical protein